jgi:hypothetical protein
MMKKISQLLDIISEFLAYRKGLLPIIGLVLIIVNLVFQFLPDSTFLSETNLLLHVGLIISIFGILIAWAL